MDRHHGKTPSSLLRLPTELRRRIFELLFDDVRVFPRNADKQTQRLSAGDDDEAHHSNRRDFVISPITSIFQTCRTCHHEAHALFWSRATFCVYSMENHRILTDANLMRSVNKIRFLVIHYAFLSEWTPTLITTLLPQLTHLFIVRIITVITHQNLARVEQNGHVFPFEEGNAFDELPGMTLLFSLIASQPTEEKCDQLLSHFGAHLGKYSLHLHFLLRCGHVGQTAVPGAFVPVGRKHEHKDFGINYEWRV